MEPDKLCVYIVDKHHGYLYEKLPVINELIRKVVNAHGEKYGYLNELKKEFRLLSEELNGHMAKEERVLFPLIKYLVETKKLGEKPKTRGYGTINNPVAQMVREHDLAAERLSVFKKITDNYKLPADACTTFSLLYECLKEFEYDLHLHIHLENNILFPKSVELENQLINRR
ncbi:hemerythrin domain-containing protein [Melioribacter sp. Ez-97]|uniref:hemerythrin domain-containing protein n=1 Tax=Melioribacter sp. Ez-97 TaxID=3423434 RepID=UPI003EDA9FD3